MLVSRLQLAVLRPQQEVTRPKAYFSRRLRWMTTIFYPLMKYPVGHQVWDWRGVEQVEDPSSVQSRRDSPRAIRGTWPRWWPSRLLWVPFWTKTFEGGSAVSLDGSCRCWKMPRAGKAISRLSISISQLMTLECFLLFLTYLPRVCSIAASRIEQRRSNSNGHSTPQGK